MLPSSYLFIFHSYRWAVVGKGLSWCCSQRHHGDGMFPWPGETSSIQSISLGFWGAEQPIMHKTFMKVVALISVPALGWRGCRKPLQELLLVKQRPMS